MLLPKPLNLSIREMTILEHVQPVSHADEFAGLTGQRVCEFKRPFAVLEAAYSVVPKVYALTSHTRKAITEMRVSLSCPVSSNDKGILASYYGFWSWLPSLSGNFCLTPQARKPIYMSFHTCIHFRACGVEDRVWLNVDLRLPKPSITFHEAYIFELSGQLKG